MPRSTITSGGTCNSAAAHARAVRMSRKKRIVRAYTNAKEFCMKRLPAALFLALPAVLLAQAQKKPFQAQSSSSISYSVVKDGEEILVPGVVPSCDKGQ